MVLKNYKGTVLKAQKELTFAPAFFKSAFFTFKGTDFQFITVQWL